MLFLFGMFVVGEALVASGYLFTIGDRIFRHTKTPDQVVLAVLFLSPRRFAILRTIDWPTLVFFAAMFVLMESVWQTGFFQQFVSAGGLTTVPALLATSVLFSQFISNVPFVALFLPMVMQAGGTPAQLMTLLARSTLAGNLTILGAASNVIIVQNAEKQGETLTFYEFARVGVPLTLLQMAVYWIFLGVLSPIGS